MTVSDPAPNEGLGTCTGGFTVKRSVSASSVSIAIVIELLLSGTPPRLNLEPIFR